MAKDIRTSNETFDENEPFTELDICERIMNHLAEKCIGDGWDGEENRSWERECLDLLHESFRITDHKLMVAYQSMMLDVMKE